MTRLLERVVDVLERSLPFLRMVLGRHDTSEEIVRRYVARELKREAEARPEPDLRADAQRGFLEEMARQHKEERDRLRRDEELLRSRERTTHKLFVILALVCISFVVVGGYLVLRGSIVIGVLSELLALATGAGAGVLKLMAARADERRDRIAEESQEMVRVLQAIQGALAAGGKQLDEVASWLRGRATPGRDG